MIARFTLRATFACVAALAVLPGCLERKIQVTSEPPGATVWVNDTEIGRTPVSTGFKYYGVFDVRIRKEGFEPVSARGDAPTPIWEMPPIDLFATALPFTITDTVKWHYDLKPSETADAEALLTRAGELRARTKPTK